MLQTLHKTRLLLAYTEPLRLSSPYLMTQYLFWQSAASAWSSLSTSRWLIRTECSLKTATHSPVREVQGGGFKVNGNIHVCANDGFSSHCPTHQSQDSKRWGYWCFQWPLTDLSSEAQNSVLHLYSLPGNSQQGTPSCEGEAFSWLTTELPW